ncbi:MAG: RNA polymerase sigma factor [Planctomycetes bacterium]|nr:RNA polymerase sigma factor [Planctomycetota bacterium]
MTESAGPETSGADDDAELVAAFVRERSAAAFAALYARHAACVYRVVWRTVGGDDADAHDAAQEAWLRAIAALPRFEARSRLRTWLVGIALNCAREQVRRRVRHAAESVDAVPSPAARERSPDDRMRLEHALAALPDGARSVIVLHDVEGFTHAEIATVLGIDAGTSKSQLSRARALLRERLAPGSEERR